MIGDIATLQDLESKKRLLKSDNMANVQDGEMISPPAKRMKQARLPFKALTNQPKLVSSPSPQLTKKPKPVEMPSPYTPGSGKAKHSDKKTTPSKKAAGTPQAKKQSVMKGRKIGFTGEGVGKASASPEPEVSSSSEDTKLPEKECDSTVAAGSGCDSSVSSKKSSKTASLDCFVQSTQQAHVSTSDIIDLTDADDEMDDDDGDFEQPKASIGQSKAVKRKRASPAKSNTGSEKTEGVQAEEEGNNSAVNTSMSSLSSLDQTSSEEESSQEEEEEESDGEKNKSGSNSDEKKESELVKEGTSAGLAKEGATKEIKSADVGEVASSTRAEPKADSNTPMQPSTPSNVVKPVKKTPMSAKALIRLKEQEQMKEAKQKQREERKRKLEEENEVKKRQRLEQRKAKEEEKEAQRKQQIEEKKKKQMEKQQKKEQEEQERLEKKKAKEEERNKKQQESEAKQEERRKKQEERNKAEEEKKLKEAAFLMKKEKQSQMFKGFFSVQAPVVVKKPEVQGWFAPFEVKKNMVLAPCIRRDQEDLALDELDQGMQSQSSSSLYLDQLKSGSKPRKGVRTPGPVRPVPESMEVDVPSEETSSKKSKQKKPEGPKKPEGLKMKMLQFHENYRPAYYGTWQKESSAITGRNPFHKDEDTFDYEVDSDDEWEEPGESLSNSEGEDEDGDGDGDDEEEDGFFVPHGYLSAGEGGEDDEDTDNLKKRQAAKATAWENELKRRCEALKPMIITFIQVASTNKTRKDEKKKLEAYQAVPLTNLPIATSHTKKERSRGNDDGAHSMDREGSGSMSQHQRLAGGMGNKLKPVPEEAMPELIQLVHGNMAGIKSLIREFRDHWRRKQHRQATGSPPATEAAPTPPPIANGAASPVTANQGVPPPTRESPVGETGPGATLAPGQGASPGPVPGPGSGGTPSPQYLDHVEHVISKRQLDLKINSIAVREKRPQFKRICWYVNQDVLEKYKLGELPVPTSWVNGVGLRDVNASPLPPTQIAVRPAVSASTPVVSKPVVVKASMSDKGTVSSLLKASQARANQHILLSHSAMPSAFNKVVAVSTAGAPMHLPAAAQLQGAPSIGYISPGNAALLQSGLAPFQVLQMPQAINTGAFNLLQQAAATNLLANIQHASSAQVQPVNSGLLPTNVGVKPRLSPSNTGAAINHARPVVKPNPQSSLLRVVKPPQVTKVSPPKVVPVQVGFPTSPPSLPTMKKGSPQRLDTAIAKLYEASALSSPPQAKPHPAPVKKTATLTSFFKPSAKQSAPETIGPAASIPKE